MPCRIAQQGRRKRKKKKIIDCHIRSKRVKWPVYNRATLQTQHGLFDTLLIGSQAQKDRAAKIGRLWDLGVSDR